MTTTAESLKDTLAKTLANEPGMGLPLDIADQSIVEMATAKTSPEWVKIISETGKASGANSSDPKTISLPDNNVLGLFEVDEGFLTGWVKKDDPNAGNHGEILVHLPKMTAEEMVQTLKTKGILPSEPEKDPIVSNLSEVSAKMEDLEKLYNTLIREKAVSSPDYKKLYSTLTRALKNLKGDFHLHIAKSATFQDLIKSLNKSK